jgi:peptidyl-prolyl cis-trans isomerase A (cyclophilin A)
MKLRLPLLALLMVALAGSACGRSEKASPAPSPTVAAATPTPAATPLRPLLDPSKATEKAPERFRVRFETTKGPFVVEVHRKWAPRGADRFYNLVKLGYYDGVTFFRVLDDFMAQFGIHGDPKVSRVWRDARIPDDPVIQSNTRGMVTFATAGPDTRTTQIFINYKDNSSLDGMGFAPFGRVVEGLKVVDALYSGYGEGAPRGSGPDQARAQAEGNDYFRREFPKLDHIETARLEETSKQSPS